MSPRPQRFLRLRRQQHFTIYVLAGSLGIVLAVTFFTLQLSRRVETQARLSSQLLSSLASRTLSGGPEIGEIMRVVNEIEVPFIVTDNAGRPVLWNAPVIGIPMPDSLAELQAMGPRTVVEPP